MAESGFFIKVGKMSKWQNCQTRATLVPSCVLDEPLAPPCTSMFGVNWIIGSGNITFILRSNTLHARSRRELGTILFRVDVCCYVVPGASETEHFLTVAERAWRTNFIVYSAAVASDISDIGSYHAAKTPFKNPCYCNRHCTR